MSLPGWGARGDCCRVPPSGRRRGGGRHGPDGEAESRPAGEGETPTRAERGGEEARQARPGRCRVSVGAGTSSGLATRANDQRAAGDGAWGGRTEVAHAVRLGSAGQAGGPGGLRKTGGREDGPHCPPAPPTGRLPGLRAAKRPWVSRAPLPMATRHRPQRERGPRVSHRGQQGPEGLGEGEGGHSCRVTTQNHWASFSEVESVWRLVRD